MEEGKTVEITAELVPSDGTVTGASIDTTIGDTYIGIPSEVTSTIVNTGVTTACYRMKINFTGVSEGAEGMYYEFPERFEDLPNDGWSVGINPGESVNVSAFIVVPPDAIPEHEETASYDIGSELQAAEIF